MKQVLDFETASGVDLEKVGAWRYAEDPTTEVLCLCFEDSRGNIRTWAPTREEDRLILEAMAFDPEITFVAHNAGFEKAIWRRIMVPLFGFPDIPNSRWHDTMAVAAMKVLPQKLDMTCMVLGLEGKDREGSKLTNDLSKFHKKTGKRLIERTPEVMERVYSYCRQDVKIERAVLDRLGDFQPGERNVWLLDQRINERGVKVDLDYVAACQKIVDDATGPLAREFNDITGGLTFTQAVRIKEWCQSEKVWLPNLQKDTIAEVLGYDIDSGEEWDYGGEDGGNEYHLPEHVRRALEIRQLVGSASVKKLPRMRDCVGADRRARGLLQYHGAGPGRWAGRILQPQNFPRPTIQIDEKPVAYQLIVDAIMTGDHEYVNAVLGPPVQTVVSGLRHALISEPDRQFISGDYAQIEARIVLALAGQWDKVKIFETGTPYIDMATSIFNRPIDKYDDPAEYTIGKNTVLGCGFQMGDKKFHTRYAPKQPMSFATEVIYTYRNDWAPEVPKLWKALEAAALRTVWDGTPHEAYGVRYALEDGWMTARLPSGRKLYYFRPTACRKEMPWSTEEEPDIRPAWFYYAMKMGQWKRIDAFGGHLTENVVQALARDILVASMFRLEKNGFPLVLTVHDENLGEPKIADADEAAFKQIMEERPQWAIDLRVPIAVEMWTGDRYRK